MNGCVCTSMYECIQVRVGCLGNGTALVTPLFVLTCFGCEATPPQPTGSFCLAHSSLCFHVAHRYNLSTSMASVPQPPAPMSTLYWLNGLLPLLSAPSLRCSLLAHPGPHSAGTIRASSSSRERSFFTPASPWSPIFTPSCTFCYCPAGLISIWFMLSRNPSLEHS